AERGRLKRAQARQSEAAPRPAPTLADALADSAAAVRTVRRYPPGHWEELWSEAWSGEVAFASGSLLFAVTPAMTLVDIDGSAAPSALALGAVAPLAHALRRFDLGGAIGI